MKKLDSLANEMIYGDMVRRIAEERNIELTEARAIVSNMTFKEYQLSEQTVTPPSGSTIGPSTQPPNENDAANQAANGGIPTGAKGIWVKGTPPQAGMVVLGKSRNGLPIPVTIKNVDMGRKGVIIKNPETNQEEMYNIDSLQPYTVGGSPKATPTQTSQTAQQAAVGQVGNLGEDTELSRMLKLAGIQENCSGGATGAGAIAIAPAGMGKIKRREPAEEGLKTEYTPRESAKTIIGDTKPNQASGKLSADLAATGKKAAGRINNGKKRVR